MEEPESQEKKVSVSQEQLLIPDDPRNAYPRKKEGSRNPDSIPSKFPNSCHLEHVNVVATISKSRGRTRKVIIGTLIPALY